MATDVSIIIRAHNDEKFIPDTLKSIFGQRFDGKFEVLLFDDGSSDRTLEICRSFPELKIFSAPDGAYVPGKVLNFSLSHAHGDMIVFNNSDAEPESENWLSELIRPLSDAEVGAVFANQKCRNDAEILVLKDHERAFGDGTVSRNWPNFFSLASSAARREVFRDFPFREDLQYSEDVEWAHRLRCGGKKVVYVPSAVVLHSHNYNSSQLRRRFYNEGYADWQIFHKPCGFFTFLRQFTAEFLRDCNYLLARRKSGEIKNSAVRRFLQKYYAYLGNSDAKCGLERRLK